MHFNRTFRPRTSVRGFSLIELMVVVAIMALLATLTLWGMRYAQIKAKRDKTTGFHRSIISSLENYHSEFNEYPEPRADKTSDFGGKEYQISGALMLYQALSGDGDNEIRLANSSGRPSNGRVDDNELDSIKMHDMPRDLWKDIGEGYIVIDGFGHPFQYTKFKTGSGGSHAATGETVRASAVAVNNTFDLWSYAEDDQHTMETGVDAKKDVKTSARWIKNW